MRFTHLLSFALFAEAAVAFAQPVAAQTPVSLTQYDLAFATPSGYRRPTARELPPTVRAVYMAKGPIVNNFASTINIQTQSVPYSTLPPNFDAQVAGVIAQQLAPASSNLRVLGSKKGTVAGVQALEVMASFQLKGASKRVHTSQVFLARNNRLFTITFMTEDISFAQQYPVFGRFLRSIKWQSGAGNGAKTPADSTPTIKTIVIPKPNVKIAKPPPL